MSKRLTPERIAEMRIIHDGCDETCQSSALLAHVAALTDELQDWDDNYDSVMKESCDGDGMKHCSCIPLLKKHVAALEADCRKMAKTLAGCNDYDGEDGRTMCGECREYDTLHDEDCPVPRYLDKEHTDNGKG